MTQPRNPLANLCLALLLLFALFGAGAASLLFLGTAATAEPVRASDSAPEAR